MDHMTPYIRGWESFLDGFQFGRNIPENYGRKAQLAFLRGWKASRKEAKKYYSIAAEQVARCHPDNS